MRDTETRAMPLGALVQPDGVEFRVWATGAQQVEVILHNQGRAVALAQDGQGYWVGLVPGVSPGERYRYRLDGDKIRPDPASRWQPDGVHGASAVVDPAFAWRDQTWQGLPLEALVIYELHVGTFTPEGTFDAVIAKLPYLRDLGVTAIELLPVADFPGRWNWGYDGVNLFAPSRAYGGPDGLRRLVDAAHAEGLAVLLDVVYNHLGPDGNYLRDFAPEYFTSEHVTPWGEAINFAVEPVRNFFVQNALLWAREYHLDGLRLDAVHAILDDSEKFILQYMAEHVRAMLPPERHFLFIAEDGRNEAKLVTPVASGGYGLDGVWADDFHHQMRVLLAGDRDGYFSDYRPLIADLVQTLQMGWFHIGQFSTYNKAPRGTPVGRTTPPQFVHCLQNHDQIGNRPLGGRLAHDISPAAYKAAVALLLLSPYTPLLFQGQEWAASTPWLYFTDHHAELGKLVTEGRRKEFATFAGFAADNIPDPQDPSTFERSKLEWAELNEPMHQAMHALHRRLVELRRHPALGGRSRSAFHAAVLSDQMLCLRRTHADATILLITNLHGSAELELSLRAETQPPAGRSWQLVFCTEGGDPLTNSRLRLATPATVVLEAV